MALRTAVAGATQIGKCNGVLFIHYLDKNVSVQDNGAGACCK
jgi:hypothetical protein